MLIWYIGIAWLGRMIPWWLHVHILLIVITAILLFLPEGWWIVVLVVSIVIIIILPEFLSVGRAIGAFREMVNLRSANITSAPVWIVVVVSRLVLGLSSVNLRSLFILELLVISVASARGIARSDWWSITLLPRAIGVIHLFIRRLESGVRVLASTIRAVAILTKLFYLLFSL